MAMIKCKSCGKMVSENSSTCTFCGKSISHVCCPSCNSKDVGFDWRKRKHRFNILYLFAIIPGLIYDYIYFAKNGKTEIVNVCHECGKAFKTK